MDKEEVLDCSNCNQEIPHGGIIYILCPACAMAMLNIPDPDQLTLFELPAPSEIV